MTRHASETPALLWLLLRRLFLFEQAHHIVDGILLLLPILAAGNISRERILEQAAGNSLYVGRELRIGSCAGDAEGDSHPADSGFHLEGELIRRADGPVAGEHADRRNRRSEERRVGKECRS